MKRTPFGQALRATIQHPRRRPAGRHRHRPVAGYGFGLGLATAAIGGTALSLDTTIYPSLHWHWIGPLMAIIVVGGLGSVPGRGDRRDGARPRAEPAADPARHHLGADGLLPRALRHAGWSGRRDSSEVVLPSASERRSAGGSAGSGRARRSPPPSCRSRRWRPNPYILSVGHRGAHDYAVLSTSWNFVGGFTGYISLGHGALSGLGAYGTGLLVAKAGLPSFVALAAGAALSSRCSRCRSASPALRVRGASFVIVSIALVLILLLVFQSWASFTGGSTRPGGARGRSPACCGPSTTGSSSTCSPALLAVALLAWWAIDRSRFGAGPQGDPRGRGQGPVARRRRRSRTSWSASSSRRSSPRWPAACTRCGSATSTRSSSSPS